MGSLHFYISSSLLLLFVTILELSVGGESKTHWEDIEGLKKLKGEISPASINPGSCVSSWDFSVDPCDHIFSERFTCGFRCERVVSGWKRVTEISLDRAGYSGSLSTSTWNFPYLEILDLTDNSFTGSIPSSLSNLVGLRRLVLSRNSFSGSIPNSIGGSLSKLEELYLDYNHLQGPIPLSFNNLVSLKRLGVQGNKLNGGFPSLGSLKSLIFLDASDNEISGRIPSNLPPSLVQILMRNNKLEGSLPEKIENLGYLQVIDLSHNILSGSVPSSLFTHPSLQQVTLSHNKFSSLQVPPNKKNSGSELLALDLSYNELQGNLPPFMAMMPRLSALSLEKNRFTGMIPSQYALKTVSPVMGSSQFVRLLLGGNYLVGAIPRPLMALKPGSAIVSLVDNCLHRCPSSFFFCQGGVQKSSMACKNFARTVAVAVAAAAIPSLN